MGRTVKIGLIQVQQDRALGYDGLCDRLYTAAESSQIDAVSPGAYTGLIAPDGTVLYRLPRDRASYQVVEVEMEKPPVTHTTGNSAYSENIRLYTSRCRCPDAYGALTEPAGNSDWNRVFMGNIPGRKD